MHKYVFCLLLGFVIGSYCQSFWGAFICIISLLTVFSVFSTLVCAVINLDAIPDVQKEAGIVQRWRARKAREHWRDAKRLVVKHLRVSTELDL